MARGLSSTAAAEGAGAGERPRVLVIGGGFGGLHAAKALGAAPVDVLVLDRSNHHLFQPLLYQVATAALSGVNVARPIRTILRRQSNTTVLLGDVIEIRPDERRVVLADGERMGYDQLILAAGLETSYFGNQGWEPHAPGLKTLSDALGIRRRMLLAFEAAEREPEPEGRRSWQTFVVVGGGPTGVELAGALREIATRTMVGDFRCTDPEQTRVVLVEGAERVLPTFPEPLSRSARRMLERLGVEVVTGRLITGLDAQGVWIGGERLEARTVLWAAGVRAVPLTRTLGAPLSRDGRVLVNPDLTVPGHPEIHVVGDLAALRQAGPDSEWVPAMAPAAIQEGRHAALNALRALRGEALLPFEFRDRGVLATVGRAAAVARIGRWHFSGLVAWLLWLGVHIAWLIGFRNRLVVLIDWAWAYLTYQRNARIVVDLSASHDPPPEPDQVPPPMGAEPRSGG